MSAPVPAKIDNSALIPSSVALSRDTQMTGNLQSPTNGRQRFGAICFE
jgi:hypothetical protein